MTKNLYNSLSRAFKNESTPTIIVGVTADERVYIVAKIYESYLPKMPAHKRNRGYICTGLFELIDKDNYCGLREVVTGRGSETALNAFSDRAHAEHWQTANDEAELEALLAKITQRASA